jgi:predicted DNA-binding protein YlxM (UPF0122 family)
MDNVNRIAKLKDSEYKELFGVKKSTFEKMLEILNEQFTKEHAKGGKPPKLSVLDKLIIMLCYYREYRTMQHIAFDYEVTKGTICNSIHWVENTLVKSGAFSLPSKRELYTDTKIEVVLIDATEIEIERPKKDKNNTTQVKRKNIH